MNDHSPDKPKPWLEAVYESGLPSGTLRVAHFPGDTVPHEYQLVMLREKFAECKRLGAQLPDPEAAEFWKLARLPEYPSFLDAGALLTTMLSGPMNVYVQARNVVTHRCQPTANVSTHILKLWRFKSDHYPASLLCLQESCQKIHERLRSTDPQSVSATNPTGSQA